MTALQCSACPVVAAGSSVTHNGNVKTASIAGRGPGLGPAAIARPMRPPSNASGAAIGIAITTHTSPSAAALNSASPVSTSVSPTAPFVAARVVDDRTIDDETDDRAHRERRANEQRHAVGSDEHDGDPDNGEADRETAHRRHEYARQSALAQIRRRSRAPNSSGTTAARARVGIRQSAIIVT